MFRWHRIRLCIGQISEKASNPQTKTTANPNTNLQAASTATTPSLLLSSEAHHFTSRTAELSDHEQNSVEGKVNSFVKLLEDLSNKSTRAFRFHNVFQPFSAKSDDAHSPESSNNTDRPAQYNFSLAGWDVYPDLMSGEEIGLCLNVCARHPLGLMHPVGLIVVTYCLQHATDVAAGIPASDLIAYLKGLKECKSRNVPRMSDVVGKLLTPRHVASLSSDEFTALCHLLPPRTTVSQEVATALLARLTLEAAVLRQSVDEGILGELMGCCTQVRSLIVMPTTSSEESEIDVGAVLGSQHRAIMRGLAALSDQTLVQMLTLVCVATSDTGAKDLAFDVEAELEKRLRGYVCGDGDQERNGEAACELVLALINARIEESSSPTARRIVCAGFEADRFFMSRVFVTVSQFFHKELDEAPSTAADVTGPPPNATKAQQTNFVDARINPPAFVAALALQSRGWKSPEEILEHIFAHLHVLGFLLAFSRLKSPAGAVSLPMSLAMLSSASASHSSIILYDPIIKHVESMIGGEALTVDVARSLLEFLLETSRNRVAYAPLLERVILFVRDKAVEDPALFRDEAQTIFGLCLSQSRAFQLSQQVAVDLCRVYTKHFGAKYIDDAASIISTTATITERVQSKGVESAADTRDDFMCIVKDYLDGIPSETYLHNPSNASNLLLICYCTKMLWAGGLDACVECVLQSERPKALGNAVRATVVHYGIEDERTLRCVDTFIRIAPGAASVEDVAATLLVLIQHVPTQLTSIVPKFAEVSCELIADANSSGEFDPLLHAWSKVDSDIEAYAEHKSAVLSRAVEKMAEMVSGGRANVLHVTGLMEVTVGSCEHVDASMKVCLTYLVRSCDQLISLHCLKILHSMANGNWTYKPLLHAAVRRVLSFRRFAPYHLTTLLQLLRKTEATSVYSADELSQVLDRITAVILIMNTSASPFSDRQTATILSAMSHLDSTRTELCKAFTPRLIAVVDTMDVITMAAILLSMARLGYRDDKLLETFHRKASEVVEWRDNAVQAVHYIYSLSVLMVDQERCTDYVRYIMSDEAVASAIREQMALQGPLYRMLSEAIRNLVALGCAGWVDTTPVGRLVSCPQVSEEN